MCIIRFCLLIAIYIFISLVLNVIFLIVENSCFREELSDVVSFLHTQLQQITVQEHIIAEFALTSLNFGLCTSPTDTYTLTYHFLSVSIPITHPLTCSPICAIDYFQRFQRQIDILDNPFGRRCSQFWFPYTLQSSGNLLWCRETEAHIHLLLICYVPLPISFLFRNQLGETNDFHQRPQESKKYLFLDIWREIGR